MINNKFGILYGVSVGTGDPELITIKALKIIRKCPVVAFPAGIKGKQGIAESIIQGYLQPQQKTLPLAFPYSQNQAELSRAWQSAAEQVCEYLQRGQDVAFACEGDVSFYSTFSYLAETLDKLQPGVNIQRIPGVSSPMAVANCLKIPLTAHNDKLVVLPALYSVEDLEKVLDWAETVVLLKVSAVYSKVWQVLQRRNLLTSAWVVEKVSFADQKVYYPLNSHSKLQLSYFSLLIVKT